MRAYRSTRRVQLITTLLVMILAIWSIRHIVRLIESSFGIGGFWFYVSYLFTFFLLAISMILSSKEKPYSSISLSDDHYVTVIVPAYNEDPKLLKACLKSLLTQSRKPDMIFFVDDGSSTSKYSREKYWFKQYAKRKKIESRWVRKKNEGKRRAQVLAVKRTPKTSIYITVDSDSVLDNRAIEEGLKPFDNKQIYAVAGVVLAINNTANLLARFTDLLFVTGQLIDRSMMSYFGSVLVNSGGLAFYRSEVIRDNIDHYINEKFFNKRIEFSDDSMLTLFALRKGKTVQQPTAFVFTMMPENVNHHIRQQVRWMKGSFIRSWWRLKYLPIMSFGFFRQAAGWIQLALTLVLFVIIFMIFPFINPGIIPYLILVPILISYIQGIKYLTIKRSDQTTKSQIYTYLLSPIAGFWSFLVFRPLRVYAMATVFNTSWGTRKKVEVGL